ncbi:MAG TPA: hypothetical protein VGN00_02545 [Puia sp.]|jgi:hypothetical protein
MKRLKIYLPIRYKLIIDLVLLTYAVIRQVILPNRRQKGNLLSSMFLLFAGLTDRLITFRKNMIMMPWSTTERAIAPWITTSWIYSKKYLRHGMVIASWALFILSSFEWSGPARSLATQNQQEIAESIQLPVTKTASTSATLNQLTPINTIAGIIYRPSLPSPKLTTKTWLRLCTLRL